MDPVREELDRMLKNGVIKKVTQPTSWCAPMVPVVKKNGKIRLCIDLKNLNKAVLRENFALKTLDDIAPNLVGAKYFTTLDAASGFWQIPLHEDSQLLTTFITPFGRYAFKRLPFGINSAPEIFQRKMVELLTGLEGVEVIIDDILVHGKSLEQHDQRLAKVLNVINEAGLRLNDEKCHYRQKEVTYFGHCIGENGVRPDESKLSAMKNLKPPVNVKELRSVIGMFQYLGRFVYDLSSIMKPMTDLLKLQTVWSWGTDQKESFDTVKRLICESPTLAYYDKDKPVIVSADASSYGLGGVLLQPHEEGLKPVAFCSRTLTETERRYSQIEKECLASVYVCEKFSRFLIGLPSFVLYTDHKPLVPLFNSKTIDNTPIRCQRLLLRMMRFNGHVNFVPGKDNIVADVLSRMPQTQENKDLELSAEIQQYVDTVQAVWPMSSGKLSEMKRATEKDVNLQSVIYFVLNGWPKSEAVVPSQLKPFYTVRSELSELWMVY